MSEVVFVTPNFMGYVREEPVGTLLLATILNDAKISTKIMPFYRFGDVEDFPRFIESAVENILSVNPAIVSFYTRCDTYHISIKIAQQIKKERDDVYIVFAGPQADISAIATIRAIDEVDFICCGEGETTIVPFFSSLISRKPDYTIPGLVFRDGDKPVCNPRPELIADLDSLPAIDYTLLDYLDHSGSKSLRNLFPVDVGRGCPFSCTFCSTKAFWGRKYRLKSAERIIAEIKEIHQRFGTTQFNFEHDMFTMNRNKVIDICGKLKTIGFPIIWRCSARIDCLDNELIDIMVDAGMTFLFVGIETGSPRMQKVIQKNLKLNDAYEKLSYISSKGVNVTASFIFGFPDETEDDFNETVGLMAKLCRIPEIYLQHHLCAFFSGTELTARYLHNIEMTSKFSKATREIAVDACKDLIIANPALFPHYFAYHNELREKIKYYSEFFNCWSALRPVYEYIACQYYNNRYCDMLYDFTADNKELLEANSSLFELLKQDRFLARFRDDSNFEFFKEFVKFAIWKSDPNAAGRNVFGFDVKAFLNGADLSQIKPMLAVVSFSTDAAGNRNFMLHAKA